jgi:hypothetical protein
MDTLSPCHDRPDYAIRAGKEKNDIGGAPSFGMSRPA